MQSSDDYLASVNHQHAGASATTVTHVELTAPYFHTGSKLTLRQEFDFYDRGGDFPITNSAHRDFLIMNLDEEDEALGWLLDPVTGLVVPPGTPGAVPEFNDVEKEASVAVIDFLLELTDERVKFERAPFDHPEIIVPLDGTAPDITGGTGGVTPTTYEAENAVLSGAVVSTAVAGYTGTGFVDYLHASNDYIEWTVTVPAAGQYNLQFRYGLASGNRPLRISVNGSVAVSSLSFPATGSFSTWSTVSTIVTLNSGANTVRATAIGCIIDYLK
jgi:hypothetical protein